MAREAAIKVSLRSSSFNSDVRQMESRIGSAGRRMGMALKAPLSAGLDAAKKSISDIGGGIKNAIRMAATLGGAISIGGALKTAMESETAYLQLADALTVFSKQLWDAAEAQALVERVADRTKIPIEDLRKSLIQLSSASGKVDIEELLERSGEQARRLGMEGEFIGRVYTRLVAKGVADTAEEAENLTEQFNTLFRTMLGVDLDQAIDPMDVAELAGFINTTGNSAGEMLKLISLGGERIAKDFGKANEIVEEMGLSLHQTKGIDEMTKKLKLPKGALDANKSAIENMLSVADLGPKKFKALTDAMSGDIAGEAIKQIIGVEFFDKNITQKQWKLRVEELRKELKDLGDLAVDRRRIEESDLKHKNTINSQVNDAMNDLKKAFADKRMKDAISDLAKHLPALTEAVADVVAFVAENPMTAAAIGVGGKVGLDFLGGVAGNALPSIMRKLFGFGGAGVGGGAGGIDALAAAQATAGQVGLVWRGLAASGRGAVTALAKLGEPFAGSGGIAGKAMLAAAGLAAAGAAGYALGDMFYNNIIDPNIKKDFENYEKADEVSSQARRKLKKETTVDEKIEVLESIRKELGVQAEGPSISTQFGGLLGSALSGEKSPWLKNIEKIQKLKTDEKTYSDAIRQQIAGELKSSGKYNQTWDDMLHNMERLNVVVKAFKDTMERANKVIPGAHDNTPPGNTNRVNATRGPSRPSNQDNKPGADKRR